MDGFPLIVISSLLLWFGGYLWGSAKRKVPQRDVTT